jgi:hypothetical protein
VETWQLLKKTDAPPAVILDPDRLDEFDSLRGIRCPRCEWQPEASSRWLCWNGGPEPPFKACGTPWNTFQTHGRCPGCAHQWQWTSCLRCSEWSLHEDWYQTGRP